MKTCDKIGEMWNMIHGMKSILPENFLDICCKIADLKDSPSVECSLLESKNIRKLCIQRIEMQELENLVQFIGFIKEIAVFVPGVFNNTLFKSDIFF